MNARNCDPLSCSTATDCKLLQKTFPNAWNMTSREFHTDTHARADFISYHLKDVTMKIFEEAIQYNRHLFKGKIILVLNAGFDLLFSLWAVKNGAAHVFAVDISHAADYLKAVIKTNNLDERITIIHGRLKDIELPVKEVDVILSNWMGYALLIESRIKSVIYARDKWLKKHNGIIFPDIAEMFVVGVQNSENKNRRIDWWVDVHNFNMKAIRKIALSEPIFQKVDPNEVLTMPVKVWNINLKKIQNDELRFQDNFYIDMLKSGRLEGILAYFDVHFSKSHVPVKFSTSPWAPHTNWLQSVFYFDVPCSVNVGERYYCGMAMNHVQLKDGSHTTKTALKLFSGEPKNLSLMCAMKWSIKSPLTVHDDVPNESNKYIDSKLNSYNKSDEKTTSSNSSSNFKNSLKKPIINNHLTPNQNLPILPLGNLAILKSASQTEIQGNENINLIETKTKFEKYTINSLPLRLHGDNTQFPQTPFMSFQKNKKSLVNSNLNKTKNLKHTWNNMEGTLQRKLIKKDFKPNERKCDDIKPQSESNSLNLTFKVSDNYQKNQVENSNVVSDKETQTIALISNITFNIFKNEKKNSHKPRKSKTKLKNSNQILDNTKIVQESISKGAIPKTNTSKLAITPENQLQKQKYYKKSKFNKNANSIVSI